MLVISKAACGRSADQAVCLTLTVGMSLYDARGRLTLWHWLMTKSATWVGCGMCDDVF